jgi:hypothetical protein
MPMVAAVGSLGYVLGLPTVIEGSGRWRDRVDTAL